MEARPAAGPAEVEQARALRVDVFCGEQGIDREAELDHLDELARHIVVVRDGRVVGTCRMLREPGSKTARLGRMAVAAAARGEGLGGRLIEAAHAWALADGVDEIVLHAQLDALGFYERHGYVAEGPQFEEQGIPHRVARIRLAAAEERRGG